MVYELIEFQAKSIPRENVTDQEGADLWQAYKKLDVDFPTTKTGGQWQFKSRGVVGYIPIREAEGMRIQPKAKVSNIFRMWELAYHVPLQWLEGTTHVASMEELYSQIVGYLADHVLRRVRRGIYRAYVARTEPLPYVRGRLDLADVLRKPWDTKLTCQFDEHTADIEDNQLLLAALRVGAQNAACANPVRPRIRQAYWSLQQLVTPATVVASDCLHRTYNRLNSDYEHLHYLCSFILEHSGPSHHLGSKALRPFIVDMASLFERFVAEWIIENAPLGTKVERQMHLAVSEGVEFKPDLVIWSPDTGKPEIVLDTKYKLDKIPDPSDIAQVVAYCEALGCDRAVLLYPMKDISHFDSKVGDIRVQSISFALDDDMASAGHILMRELRKSNEGPASLDGSPLAGMVPS